MVVTLGQQYNVGARNPAPLCLTGKINLPLSQFAPELFSRETGLAVPSHVSIIIILHALRMNLVLTYKIPPVFRGDVHFLFQPS